MTIALPPNFPHAKLYDLTLAASSRQAIDVVGDFMRIRSATGIVNVRTDSGIDVDLEAGMGWRDFPYKRLEVLDKSGLANAVQLYAGGAEVILDSLPLQTADAAHLRTMREDSFVAATNIGASVGNLSQINLFMSSTTRRLAVQSVTVWTDVAQQIQLTLGSVAFGVFVKSVVAKTLRASIAAAGLYSSNPAGTPGTVFDERYVAANQPLTFSFTDPIVFPLPSWLCVTTSVANSQLRASFQGYLV